MLWNRLNKILDESINRGQPAIIKHKNGKTFEAKHCRLIRNTQSHSKARYLLVVGFGDGPGPIINHQSRPRITFQLPDFYRTWKEKIGEHTKYVSQSWFNKVITMNPANILNLADIIPQLNLSRIRHYV